MAKWLDRITRHLLPVTNSRSLTEGEKQLARSVFGDGLALDDIKINAAPWILKGFALSPNGQVYFNPKDWRQDFSQATLSEKAWLVHELTHVWQLQRGLAVVRRALVDRRYSYQLQPGKLFGQYGIEQQAQMVQDWFMAKHSGRDCTAYESCVPFLGGSPFPDNRQT